MLNFRFFQWRTTCCDTCTRFLLVASSSEHGRMKRTMPNSLANTSRCVRSHPGVTGLSQCNDLGQGFPVICNLNDVTKAIACTAEAGARGRGARRIARVRRRGSEGRNLNALPQKTCHQGLYEMSSSQQLEAPVLGLFSSRETDFHQR